MARRIISIALSLLIPALAQAQGLLVHSGADRLTAVGHRSSFVQPDVWSGKIELLRRSDGDNAFSRAYNRPYFGLGATFIDQSSTILKGTELGDALAVYGIMDRPLLETRIFGIGYDLGVGGAYTSRIFDPVSDAGNWFFGSHFVLFAKAGLHASAYISPRLQLVADAVVMHGSNARLSYPNNGLNFAGGGLSMKYSFSEPSRSSGSGVRVQSDAYQKGWAYDIQIGGGLHSCGTEWVATGRSGRWPRASLSMDAMYRFGGRFSAGVMADLFYSSNAHRLEEYDREIFGADAEAALYEFLSVGAGVLGNVHYRDFAFSWSVGRYLRRNMGVRENHGPYYNKIGFRYYSPSTPLYYGVSCKAQPFRAEYLELSLGLRLR